MTDPEYTKSLYRCPICGTLVGCSEEGRVGMFGAIEFHRHVQQCRARVKEGKVRYKDED